MTYPESEDIVKVLNHIENAIVYINKEITKLDDSTMIYELQLARTNLEMSQKIILYGLLQN